MVETQPGPLMTKQSSLVNTQYSGVTKDWYPGSPDSTGEVAVYLLPTYYSLPSTGEVEDRYSIQ